MTSLSFTGRPASKGLHSNLHFQSSPKAKQTDLPISNSIRVAFRDTDGDLMEFKQSGAGLQLFLNGETAHPTWYQLEWLKWDDSSRKLIDPSNEACSLPPNVDAACIMELALNAYPPCEWRGDVPSRQTQRNSDYHEDEDEDWMSFNKLDEPHSERHSLLGDFLCSSPAATAV